MDKRASFSDKMPQIAEVCRRHAVRELLLFGSGTGPHYRPDSDLDFLVEFLPGARVGLIELGFLQEELERVLQRQVDLVPKNGLKPLLRDRVLEQAEPIYAG